MRQLLLTLLLVGLAASAEPAEPTSDPVLATRIAELEILATNDTKAALAGIRKLLASAALPANQRAELWALECPIVLNERPLEALKLAEAALAQPSLPMLQKVRLQICRGKAFDWTGQPGPAREVLDGALTEARQFGADPLLAAEPLIALSALNTYQGALVKAAQELREAQRLLDAARAKLPFAIPNQMDAPVVRRLRELQLTVWQRYGALYANMEDSDKAMHYFRLVFADVEARGEMAGQILAHYNIGRALEELNRLEEARVAQERSLELARSADDEVGVAWARRSLGGILVQQGRISEAKPHIEAALVAFQAMSDVEIIAQLTYYRARIYRSERKNVEAEADLRAAIAIFQRNQTLRYLDKALIELAELREQGGQLADALALRRERDVIHRKLDLQIQDKAAARVQAEFDHQAQAKENQRLAELQALQAAQLADANKLAHYQYVIIVLAAIIGASVVFFAVRQLRIAHQMRTIALTDELTKVPNRRAIYALAESQWQLGTDPFSLLILDIDFFKRINDKFGHIVGDEALKLVAQSCLDQLRQGDAIGRIGGEEFLVVLPGASPAVAFGVAERLRQAVQLAPSSEIAAELALSISIGVATRSAGDGQLQALINRADTALFRAKAGGRNRVESDATEADRSQGL